MPFFLQLFVGCEGCSSLKDPKLGSGSGGWKEGNWRRAGTAKPCKGIDQREGCQDVEDSVPQVRRCKMQVAADSRCHSLPDSGMLAKLHHSDYMLRCFDYADFNAQHAMISMLLLELRVARGRSRPWIQLGYSCSRSWSRRMQRYPGWTRKEMRRWAQKGNFSWARADNGNVGPQDITDGG